MSGYRTPAPRSSEALARLGEMLAKEVGARVTVNDERLSIRGPRGDGAVIGCILVMAALAAVAFVILGFMVPTWARVARWVVAGLGGFFLLVVISMVARGRTTIDLRAGRIRSRKLGLGETGSLDGVRAVMIERAFSRDYGGDVTIGLQTTDGSLEIIHASSLRASTAARAKAFATALAAWLGVDLIERSTLATRIALRVADERLRLDVTGIPAPSSDETSDQSHIVDAASTAVDAAVAVIHLLEGL